MNSNLLSDWLGYINSNRPNEEEFGLERLRELYKKTVSQNLANKVVIVGGTNGKGTTVEYLKNFLIESGSNVGVYTSPHLINFNESCLLYTSPSPRDYAASRMPSSA